MRAKSLKKVKFSKPDKPLLTNLGPGVHFRFGVSMMHERLLGRFVIEWSRLEAILGDLVWTILDLDAEHGRIITASIETRTKIKWIKAFTATHLPEDHQHQYELTLGSIEHMMESRNLMLHGSWGKFATPGLNSFDPVVVSLRLSSPADQVVSETFPETRMRDLIASAIKARDELLARRIAIEQMPNRKTDPLYGRTREEPEV